MHVRALLAVRVPLTLKMKVMELPSFLQGDSLKRLLQGAAAGAVAAVIVGFNWGGWTLGSTVEKVAKERADTAVITALAPICVDRSDLISFRLFADAVIQTDTPTEPNATIGLENWTGKEHSDGYQRQPESPC